MMIEDQNKREFQDQEEKFFQQKRNYEARNQFLVERKRKADQMFEELAERTSYYFLEVTEEKSDVVEGLYLIENMRADVQDTYLKEQKKVEREWEQVEYDYRMEQRRSLE